MPDIGLLSINLQPLPCEFPQLFLTLVYIHPRSNTTAANQTVVNMSHRIVSICVDAPKFYLGDQNHACLHKFFHTYEQYVNCPNILKNTTLVLR